MSASGPGISSRNSSPLGLPKNERGPAGIERSGEPGRRRKCACYSPQRRHGAPGAVQRLFGSVQFRRKRETAEAERCFLAEKNTAECYQAVKLPKPPGKEASRRRSGRFRAVHGSKPHLRCVKTAKKPYTACQAVKNDPPKPGFRGTPEVQEIKPILVALISCSPRIGEKRSKATRQKGFSPIRSQRRPNPAQPGSG